MEKIKRNILLNPGPATTTDTVKYAQVVPDICPREKEFADIMKDIRAELVKIVHGDPDKYTSVLFCGSGTINIDVLMNSLVPEGKKVLVINNGAYSSRAVEVLQYYHIPYIDLKFKYDIRPDLELVEKTLQENPDIAVVHTTHNETGTGILNPIREIGALVHQYNAVFTVDTTSTYAMLPIDMDRDNLDFVMASSQKGLMAMTGLSFVVGNKEIIERTKDYPTRSYYCNLYLQYDFFNRTGEMHFTPPVQTIYSVKQAIEEYWTEGEQGKYDRHIRVWEAIHKGKDELGLKDIIKKEWQSGMVVSIKYPNDPNWDFEKIHDYCYERGFTIYPGKISTTDTFRLCSLGAIDVPDIEAFFRVLREAMEYYGVQIPAKY
ncbi:MAG: 2-aminoethylphosphonate--pyruvate transaminase [Lachnospiraceae bacterium]|nr:2-aminoethylphosphonate--pyruvate transaminase [Lachnospiraceae bacterium]